MFQDYRKKFEEITGIKESILSTVDHVYASMPIRLIDSHNILCKMGDVKIIIWDDIYPNLKKYRSELVLDCGILAVKNSEYFLFPLDKVYGLSEVIRPNFEKQAQETRLCLELTLNLPKFNKHLIEEKYLKRLECIISIYKKVSSRYPGKSSIFYKNLVVEIYKFLGFKEVAEFYKNSAESLMSSGIIDRYLPWLINETRNNPFGLLRLINGSSLINPPYFRYIYENMTVDELKTIDQAKDIIDLLETGKILPCKEIMYWLFAISEIKHFGRDFDFFKKLSEFFTSRLNIKNKISDLQLTQGKNDGTFYIQYEKDDSRQLIFLNGKLKAKKCPIPRKSTDISTIPSIYLHIGNKFREVYEHYTRSRKVLYIKMGKIL